MAFQDVAVSMWMMLLEPLNKDPMLSLPDFRCTKAAEEGEGSGGALVKYRPS